MLKIRKRRASLFLFLPLFFFADNSLILLAVEKGKGGKEGAPAMIPEKKEEKRRKRGYELSCA